MCSKSKIYTYVRSRFHPYILNVTIIHIYRVRWLDTCMYIHHTVIIMMKKLAWNSIRFGAGRNRIMSRKLIHIVVYSISTQMQYHLL